MTQEWPEALAARPVCPHRGLPIPFIAEIGPGGRGEFAILDHKQAMACIEGRLCAMCGSRMDGEIALLGDAVSLEPGGYFIEPPVHEQCGQLAAGGLCPFLSRERVPRRPVQADVSVVGSRDDLGHIGRDIAKRPVVMAIARDYHPGHVMSDAGPVLAYRPDDLIRVVRFGWRGGRLAELGPRPRTRTVRSGQPRKRPRSKR